MKSIAIWFVVLLALVVVATGALGDDLKLDERQARLERVREEIRQNGYSWTADHTPISDLSREEFHELLGLRLPEDYDEILEQVRSKPPAYAPLDLPSRFDWTDSSGVSPVRRQWCGDCWAQCSVAAMESKLRIFDGDTRRLSVQQAIDCNYGGSSCNGGWMEDTYDLYRVLGAVGQSCYRYTGTDGNCNEDTCDIIARIDGWEYIDTTVVSIKTHLMSNGPIAVGMTVYSDFDYYSGGCYEHAGTGTINHGVLIVGWDDSKCGGAGAWHIKNSWGTGWGESGYAWLKYGTCGIGTGAAIIHYSPRQPAQLVFSSCEIDDSSGDGDGKADPGETVTLAVNVVNKGWVTAAGVSATLAPVDSGVQIVTASVSFPDIDPDSSQESNSPHFVISIEPDLLCGTRLHFVLSLECDQGSSAEKFDIVVGDAISIFFDDADDDLGWSFSAPDDEATTGLWKRKNPVGSFGDSILVQTEIDHTPGNRVRCFVSGNVWRSFGPDVADVDGGKTTLTTPVIDLSGYACANLRYWRWYTNDTGGGTVDDVWLVDASGDSGATWVRLQSDSTSVRAWLPFEYNLGDHVPLTDRVLVRFVASDYGEESIVEAAVDDIEIVGCPASVDVEGPTVQVVYPNGGEEITEGTDVEIRWVAGDDYGIRQSVVVVSYDGGVTYSDTVGFGDTFDSTLVWNVPMGEHPDCRIGVRAIDRGYNEAFDESDSSFSVIRDISGVTPDLVDEKPNEPVLIGSQANPFSHSTHIFFGLPRMMATTIRVYDTSGRCVKELMNAPLSAGYHSVIWDGTSSSGSRVSSGLYFVRFEAGEVQHTAKVVLAR